MKLGNKINNKQEAGEARLLASRALLSLFSSVTLTSTENIVHAHARPLRFHGFTRRSCFGYFILKQFPIYDNVLPAGPGGP